MNRSGKEKNEHDQCDDFERLPKLLKRASFAAKAEFCFEKSSEAIKQRFGPDEANIEVPFWSTETFWMLCVETEEYSNKMDRIKLARMYDTVCRYDLEKNLNGVNDSELCDFILPVLAATQLNFQEDSADWKWLTTHIRIIGLNEIERACYNGCNLIEAMKELEQLKVCERYSFLGCKAKKNSESKYCKEIEEFGNRVRKECEKVDENLCEKNLLEEKRLYRATKNAKHTPFK